MKKDRIIALLLAAVMVFILCACSQNGETGSSIPPSTDPSTPGSSPEPADDPYADLPSMTFTYAEEGAETTPRYLCGKAFADLLYEKSGGKLTIQMYGNGTMGTSTDITASVQSGDLDFGSVEPGTSVATRLSILDAPGIWTDLDKAREVFSTDNEFMTLLNSEFETINLKNIAIHPTGGRIISSSKELATPDAVKGITLRTPPSPAIVEFWGNMGAITTVIAMNETYLALSQHLCDGQESLLDVTASSNFYEVNEHIYLTYHMLGKFSIVMNLDTYNSLPAAYQELIDECVEECRSTWTQIYEDYNEQYINMFKDYGCSVHENTPEWSAAIAEASQSIIDSSVRTDSGDALVDAALAAMGN